jgi:hypothetical protein
MERPADPFLAKLFARIPREVAASFDEAQLAAIKRAFGARDFGTHAIDVRRSLRLLWWRFYIVLLVGKERRDDERLAAEGSLFGTVGNSLITLLVIAALITPLLYALFEFKSTAGLDVAYRDGAHSTWDRLTRQVGQLFR